MLDFTDERNHRKFPTMHAHSTTHMLGNGCNEIMEIFPRFAWLLKKKQLKDLVL